MYHVLYSTIDLQLESHVQDIISTVDLHSLCAHFNHTPSIAPNSDIVILVLMGNFNRDSIARHYFTRFVDYYIDRRGDFPDIGSSGGGARWIILEQISESLLGLTPCRPLYQLCMLFIVLFIYFNYICYLFTDTKLFE